MTTDEPRSIRLDQFLQIIGVAGTGGQAKLLVQSGEVSVNGKIETRRKRQLQDGDVVSLDGNDFTVEVRTEDGQPEI